MRLFPYPARWFHNRGRNGRALFPGVRRRLRPFHFKLQPAEYAGRKVIHQRREKGHNRSQGAACQGAKRRHDNNRARADAGIAQGCRARQKRGKKRERQSPEETHDQPQGR